MRVLIDATSLVLRSAGIKNYTYHWLRNLRAEAAPGDEIRAFPYIASLPELVHERSVLSPLETYARLALLYFVNIPGNPAIDWLSRRADVFHLSNQLRTAPQRVRITATVHDLTCWMMPELHTAGNVRADKSFAEHVLKRASRLIAVSENTRADAVRILGLDPERIQTIYSGVPDAYFRAKPTPAKRPYVLFVGAIEPRKNVDGLLDAWHLLAADLRKEYELVIAGATGWSSEKTLARLLAGLPDVKYLGYVKEEKLPGLTAGATAFVYPSLYEGFGFPIAQAMACGVPVITSNNSCLPEIAGEGAVLVDPRSPCEITGALERVLTSASLRDQLGLAGAERAQQYRWDICARKSLEFFHSVV